MNAEQYEDDRRRHSTKEAAALMRQPPHIFAEKIPLLQEMIEDYPAYLSGLGSAFRHRISLVKPLVNEVPDT